MNYDPFSLDPPKSIIKQAIIQLKEQASELLDDVAVLRQNNLAGWLVEEKLFTHSQLVHRITRYQMFLRDVEPNSDWQQTKLAAKARPIADFFPNKLRKSGVRLYGKCCFHPDKTPSFVIYTKDNSAKCFGCGWFGDSIAFVMKLHPDLDFKAAISFLTS